MRIAFTIILNGLHHLKHNNYANYLCKNLDYWIIIDGLAKPTGSTSWCNYLDETHHNNGRSNDGTLEYIEELRKNNKNVVLINAPSGGWDNKDVQCNAAFDVARKITSRAWLWQIDCDEQWTLENMMLAETKLKEENGKTADFSPIHFVGKYLIAKGSWGETPMVRLWDWNGERLLHHEPCPTLEGGNGHLIHMPFRYNHYSYYFEKDVIFKSIYYQGHQNVYKGWKGINKRKEFPCHISELFLGEGYSNSNAWIHRYKSIPLV